VTYSRDEFLICVIARMLTGARHIAVGAASPIAGSAALMMRALTDGDLRVSLIHSRAGNPFTDGGREIFDAAGQGRIDVFFLGGGQIDGSANVNLVGIGDYPAVDVRFPGSFGSAFMYFVVPRVILFREEHTRRVMVPKVDFISAPGTSPPDVHRPGGPHAMVTGLCVMDFDRDRARFVLRSVHPGHTVEEVRDNTGFEFDVPDSVVETPEPEADRLDLLRKQVGAEIADTYPDIAAQVFGHHAAS
jgi:glutaconate CoA-transferase subunit B